MELQDTRKQQVEQRVRKNFRVQAEESTASLSDLRGARSDRRGGGVTEYIRVPVVAPAGTAPGYGCAKHRASLPGTVHSMLVGG